MRTEICVILLLFCLFHSVSSSENSSVKSCFTSTDCTPREECYDKNDEESFCLCNYIYLFYGERCSKTSPFLLICALVLLVYVTVILLMSSLTFIEKVKESKKKLNASVTASFLIFLALLFMDLIQLMRILMAVEVGDISVLLTCIVWLTILCGAMCTLSTLNVSMLWIELGINSSPSARTNNLRTTKYIVVFMGIMYILCSAAIYVRSGEVSDTFVMAVLYEFLIGISFWWGSKKLVRKLNSGQASNASSLKRKTVRITQSARLISITMLCEFVMFIGYMYAVADPATRYLPFILSFLLFSFISTTLAAILWYVRGGKMFFKSSGKLFFSNVRQHCIMCTICRYYKSKNCYSFSCS